VRDLDAEAFCSALGTYQLNSHPNLIKHARAQTLVRAGEIRRRLQAGEGLDTLLLSMVEIAYPLQAATSVDRIFATLLPSLNYSNILFESIIQRSGLSSYSFGQEETFLKMANLLNSISPGTPYITLSLAGNTRRTLGDSSQKLPTWVPDWSDPQEVDICQLNRPSSTYSAWGKARLPSLDMLSDIDRIEGLVMYFKAVEVDTVDQIALYQPPRRPSDRLRVSALNSIFFSAWWDWVQEKRPDRYRGDEDKYSLRPPLCDNIIFN
jgi:hypothetical protein